MVKNMSSTYDGVEQSVDLTKLEPIKIDFKNLSKGTNEFSYTSYPNSKRKITFKLLNGKDEKDIDLEKLKKNIKVTNIN